MQGPRPERAVKARGIYPWMAALGIITYVQEATKLVRLWIVFVYNIWIFRMLEVSPLLHLECIKELFHLGSLIYNYLDMKISRYGILLVAYIPR